MAICHPFGCGAYTIEKLDIGEIDHLATIFQHSNPKSPIFASFELGIVTAYAQPIRLAIHSTGRYHIFTRQKIERVTLQLPLAYPIAKILGARDDNLDIRVSHQDLCGIRDIGWRYLVVGIDRQYKLARSKRDGVIASKASATIRLRIDLHSLIIRSILLRDGDRGIFRAIVHTNNLEIGIVRSQNRGERFGKIALGIIYRNNNRNEHKDYILSNPLVYLSQ